MSYFTNQLCEALEFNPDEALPDEDTFGPVIYRGFKIALDEFVTKPIFIILYFYNNTWSCIGSANSIELAMKKIDNFLDKSTATGINMH